MVMRHLDADVLGVIEAESRIALKNFSSILLKKVGADPYAHVMVVDGNDDRGIDVGLLTKGPWEIVGIRSHVDDDPDGQIFSRDYPEYTLATKSGKRLVVLVNHFKSKGYGKAGRIEHEAQGPGRTRREDRQAAAQPGRDARRRGG